MTIRVTAVDPGQSLPAIAAAIDQAKNGSPLQPVSVLVPTNATGVAVRRYLGRTSGIAAVDMLTIDRLAEVIAGPALALHRRPISAPVLELTVGAVLADEPGMFYPVREHASTVTALRELYEEVRLAGSTSHAAMATGSARAAAAAQIISGVGARLRDDWYDRADLFTTAADLLGSGTPPPAADHVIIFLPNPLAGVEATFVAALSQTRSIEILVAHTGVPALDDEYARMAERVGTAVSTPADLPPTPAPSAIISVTDADEEVRTAVRTIVDAARDGTSLDRIAVLWPQAEPYARLVEHHLGRAGIPWNGRPGTQIAERIVPRFLLDLLELDRRGLRRSSLFELLADINVRAADGTSAPTSAWERIARAAGVASEDDWTPRLQRYAARQRHLSAEPDGESARAHEAEALLAFVQQLRRDLGAPWQRRSWTEWAQWARDQITTRLGDDLLRGRAEAERLASDHTMRVLDRLGHLDSLGGGDVTRAAFRAVFAAEFDVAPGRLGRLGHGVTVGSLAGFSALDVDVAIVLGAAEGTLPATPRVDPLLNAADRSRAGLDPTDAAPRRVERQFIAALRAARSSVIVYPRGDLRGTSERVRSRWLDTLGADPPESVVASHHSALLHNPFPANESEFRLRRHLAMAVPGPLTATQITGTQITGTQITGTQITGPQIAGDDPTPEVDLAGTAEPIDTALARALTLRAARRSAAFTEFDGNLTAVEVPRFERPVSPSQIEAWPSCPNAYFQRYLLGVYPVDDPILELSISALERGNVIHHTLDRFHREVIDGALPQPSPVWTATHVERAVEIFDEVADQFQQSGRTGRPAAWSIERRRLLNELTGWFMADSKRLALHPATIVSSEAEFGRGGDVTLALGDDRRLSVYGSIDRVDARTDGLVVVDHKTGNDAKFKRISAADPTDGGRVFQLPVYAAGARVLAGQPDATVTALYSMMSRGGYQQYGYTLTPSVEADVGTHLAEIVDGIELGIYPPNPEKPGFKVFVSCHYCDPDGLGTASLHEQMAPKWADPMLRKWSGEDGADAGVGGES